MNKRQKDDKWDPVSREYLSYFYYGTAYRKYREHKLMMQLSRRVEHYLAWTKSPADWEKFEALLRKFSDQKHFERIIIDAKLSRTESYDELSAKQKKGDLNSRYRLYDFPDRQGRMQQGRISWINDQEPYLVVSLHMNPAGAGHKGGMAAVLSPGYETFDMIRRIHLGELPRSRFDQSPWNKLWLVTDPGWSQFEAARADTWVYFNGFRTNRKGTDINDNKNRGIRYNMMQWRYADPPGWWKLYDPDKPGRFAVDFKQFRAEDAAFWDREKAKPERWRREGGRLGYGGDNHYATDELMRFVQHGVRVLEPKMRSRDAIGPIQPPYVSTYSLPTFVNAVVAYLEIAFINRTRDRDLVIEEREEVAQSLAVGIYSLFRSVKPKSVKGNEFQPRGEALDWSRYENYDEGNYFKIVND